MGNRNRTRRAGYADAGVYAPVRPAQQHAANPAEGTVRGEHLWIMTAAWRVDPVAATDPDGQNFLDTENLLTLEGPGCYVCEQPYQPGMERTTCPGEP